MAKKMRSTAANYTRRTTARPKGSQPKSRTGDVNATISRRTKKGM